MLIPELLALLGAVQTARANGSIFDPPVLPSNLLLGRADQLYLLGEAGGRILQAIGMLSGMAAQTERYQQAAGNPQILSPRNRRLGVAIWNNHIQALDLIIMNIEEAVERLREF